MDSGSSSLLRPPAVLIACFALVVVILGCANTAYGVRQDSPESRPRSLDCAVSRSTGPVYVQLLGAGCVTTAGDGGGARLAVPLRGNDGGRGRDAA